MMVFAILFLQREDEVKQKFRSYDELKKDFESMNMDIKTDAEIIEELLSQLKRPDTQRDNMLTILTDLEYYLHQVSILGHLLDVAYFSLSRRRLYMKTFSVTCLSEIELALCHIQTDPCGTLLCHL